MSERYTNTHWQTKKYGLNAQNWKLTDAQNFEEVIDASVSSVYRVNCQQTVRYHVMLDRVKIAYNVLQKYDKLMLRILA